MDARAVSISRRGARVNLAGDPSTLAWVEMRGSGYFHFATDAADDDSWRIIAGREHAHDVPRTMHSSATRVGEHCAYWTDSERRVVVIDAPAGPWRDLWCLRAVRHLLRWQLFHAGALFLHGGTVAYRGTGIALLGPSRAGKTTMLLQALRLSGVAFVAEDDLTIVEERSGEFVALGWPGCVRLRTNTIPSFPEFARVDQFSHPENSLRANGKLGGGLLRIFPEELSAVLGCPRLPEVPLRAAAWLAWGEQPTITRMSADQIRAGLEKSWDILPERKPGTRPRLVGESVPNARDYCFNSFLHDAFSMPSLAIFSEALARQARTLNGYRVRHTGRAREIDRLFKGKLMSYARR